VEWTTKEYLSPETKTPDVYTSAAAAAFEARLSKKAAVALYD
jgi:hypothetical protein